MKMKYERVAVLVAPWLLAASLPAAATGISQWGFDSCTSSAGGSLYGSCSDSSPLPALTYTAISNSAANIASGTSNEKGLAAAYVGNYSPNLGVTTRRGPNNASGGSGADETTAAPDHAMDNNGNYEFMLLSFTSAVTLNDIGIGYHGFQTNGINATTDSDITVLALSGAAAGSLGSTWMNGKTYGNGVGTGTTGLVNAGWTIIGNYIDVWDTTTTVTGIGAKTHTVAVNSGNVSSSYWLVGTYNSAFGTTGKNCSTGTCITQAGNGSADYVKLTAIYGTPGGGGGGGAGSAPEPSSLLLMGIALAGLTMARRRGVI